MVAKLLLVDEQPPISLSSESMVITLITRIGLLPKKKGSTQSMHRILIELYERAKKASAQKDPKLAVMTVEEMAIYAKITRQTMYEYLPRWLDTGIIHKVSYIEPTGRVLVGYRLSANTLEDSFAKMQERVLQHMTQTAKLVVEFSKMLKNEKISQTMKKQHQEEPEESDKTKDSLSEGKNTPETS